MLIFNLDFQVNLEFEKSGDDLQMHFPITIATVPFRIPNSNQQPNIHYGNIFINVCSKKKKIFLKAIKSQFRH